jgi:hypothetical protein
MNPTQAVLEERVAALEGGTAALAVASGHAAQLLVFHALLRRATSSSPRASSMAARSTSSTTPSRASTGASSGPIRTISPPSRRPVTPKTKAIFIESIANPGGVRHRHRRRRRDRHRHGMPLIVDNTLATPYLMPPARARRRHRRAFADQVHRRPRQFHRRRHRRRRHVRLDGRAAIRSCPSRARNMPAWSSPRPSAISPSPSPAACSACATSARRSRRSTRSRS